MARSYNIITSYLPLHRIVCFIISIVIISYAQTIQAEEQLNAGWAPIAVFCADGGIAIWNIDTQGHGSLALQVTGGQVASALESALVSGQHVQIASGTDSTGLWALASKELQATLRDASQPEYDFIFPAQRCGSFNLTTVSNAGSDTFETSTNPQLAQSATGAFYIVQPGDTLFQIAIRYNTSVSTLSQVNDLSDPSQIFVGQQLVVSDSAGGEIPVTPTVELPLQREEEPVSPPLPPPSGQSGITAWEYHHTTFEMSPSIKMTATWFSDQMRWLHENGYHAVTSEELAGYLNGTIRLPLRSIVLTFDLGTNHRSDYEDIVNILQQYQLHGIFFIVTEIITDDCSNNSHCWPVLQRWQGTGVVSFGSHSIRHQPYSQLSSEQILYDLIESKRVMEAHLGLIVGFAYPHEAVSSGMPGLLSQAGYAYGFGGWSRGDFSIYEHDPLWHNLPRLLPYSSDWQYPVLSTRANARTFAQLVTAFTRQ